MRIGWQRTKSKATPANSAIPTATAAPFTPKAGNPHVHRSAEMRQAMEDIDHDHGVHRCRVSPVPWRIEERTARSTVKGMTIKDRVE